MHGPGFCPGCRLSRLLPAMRCVAGRRILKLIKRLTRLRRPGEWGPRTGYPELTPIRCPDPGRPRPGLVPGLAEVRSTCPATRSARPEPVRVPRAYPDSRLNSRKIPASGCSAIHGVRLVALMMLFVMVQRQGRSHAEEAVFNLPRERACDRPRPARVAGYERGLGAYVQVVTDLPVDLAHLARGVDQEPLQHVLPHARLPEAAAHALDRFHDRIDHVGGDSKMFGHTRLSRWTIASRHPRRRARRYPAPCASLWCMPSAATRRGTSAYT